MAYSNTTGQTTVNVDQLISYAFRDAGKQAEEMTPEYVQAAKQALFYNLMDLSNMGVNLWLLENQLYFTAGWVEKVGRKIIKNNTFQQNPNKYSL